MVRRWKDTHVRSDSIAMADTISPVRLSAMCKARKMGKESKTFAKLFFPNGDTMVVTSHAAAPNSALMRYGIFLVDQVLLTAILLSCNNEQRLVLLNVYFNVSGKNIVTLS